MGPRDASESHRASTPLELLFDLVSVIAIASAAAGLHHTINEDHVLDGLIKYAGTFFAIWWAWMNFTWFASAYDNDDAVFRVLTMTNMGGALLMAAGIEPFFHTLDLSLIVAGFVIMRMSMVVLWLRAAYYDTAHRETALIYAVGITLAQCYWVGLAVGQHQVSQPLFYALFGVGMLIELSVPFVAETKGQTSWHRHHIIERYGLLNIIVLGETLLAVTMALGYTHDGHFDASVLRLALIALVILFSMWWLYFSKEEHLQEERAALAFTWGYGHLLIFASGAAVGAGLSVMVDVTTQHAHVAIELAQYAVAVPVALYMAGLWFVRDRFALVGGLRHILLGSAALILLAPVVAGLEGVAVISALSVMLRSQVACRQLAA